MIIDGSDAVLVQGMTGRQGRYWSERMIECGTKVVAGASPGKAGQEVVGRPVFGSAREAAEATQIDATVLFVPPAAALGAVRDALDAGIKRIVLLAEFIPAHDVMEMMSRAAHAGAQILGPNTAGLVVPGEASVGIMPGFAANIFRPGRIGVVSRSGSLGTLMCMNLVRSGYGQAAFIGIGGDPIIGTTTLDAVRVLDARADVDAIALVGEIGGSMEEDAAEHISTMSTPVVAFVAGRSAPADTTMGHAGAIVSGNHGSGASKVSALTEAGATVLDVPSQVGAALSAAGVTPDLVSVAAG